MGAASGQLDLIGFGRLRFLHEAKRNKQLIRERRRVEYPKMLRMRQQLSSDHITDLESHLRGRLQAALAKSQPVAGGTVAIGVGSRGVTPIVTVVRTLVEGLKAAGLRPFVIPAMGSHGGGTAEGQASVLDEYGITEDNVGAKVRATMETVLIGKTEDGVEVHMDANAHAADHVIPVGRVKLHTGMTGPIQSGLCKIMAIGLGKRYGAERLHEAGVTTQVPKAAQVMLDSGKILCGVGLVENPFDQTAHAEIPIPADYIQTDRDLLAKSVAIFPSLPTDYSHLLVVDELGKDISGSGMDSNIIGTKAIRTGQTTKKQFEFITVLRLTKASHGNAAGLGQAQFTTRQLVDDVDWNDTYVNMLTAMVPDSCPMIFDGDRACLDIALSMAKRRASADRTDIKVMRVINTMEISHFWASLALAGEIEAAGRAEVVGPAPGFTFSEGGDFIGLRSI